MNKEQKEQEQRLRILKFDCEMRLKSVEAASSLKTSTNVKSLLENAESIARYIFAVKPNPKLADKNKKENPKEVIIENKEGIIK